MPPSPARFATAPDLRALEAGLMGAIDAEDERRRADPTRLQEPAYLVVPSSSLALHLRRRLVAEGRVRLGWSVTTHAELSARILAAAGRSPRSGDVALELALRAAARAHPELAGAASSDDGLDAIAASVRDLLDAGYAPELHEVWSDALGDAAASMHALLDVAGSVREELARVERFERAATFREAARLLSDDPSLLSARAVFVHGFADATRSVVLLLSELARHPAARLWLEVPDDEAGAPRRFVERMTQFGTLAFGASEALRAAEPALLDVLAAGDRANECELVARALHAELSRGDLAPEDIGIVARDPKPYLSLLGVALTRNAVPFSAVGITRGQNGAARRIDALLRLAEEGESAPLEILSSALGGSTPELLAFQHAGAARVSDLARIEWSLHEHGTFELPRTKPDDAGGLKRDVVAIADLTRTAEVWQGIANGACELTGGATWRAVRAAFQSFVVKSLGWSRDGDPALLLDRLLVKLDREFEPDERPLELTRFLQRLLTSDGATPFGGDGGGVQVLSTTEARARTFRRLFVLGLERGSFPRLVAEDPLLPDFIRARLEGVSEEFPIKARSYDEERYLLASLTGAAEHITLSWCTDDGEGRPLAASPVVERLVRERGLLPLEVERDPVADPSIELAVRIGARQAEHLAHVLDEVERRPEPANLGPYLGLVGRQIRPERLFVTRLESWQKCPWRNLLERTLRLEPRPDPLGALPDLDARVLGSAVHETLEHALASAPHGEQEPRAFVEEQRKTNRRAARPYADVLTEVARSIAQREGILWSGFAEALERRAEPYVRAALPALGTPLVAELTASHEVPAGAWGRMPLWFRADLVEEREDGLVLTDFKTGRAFRGPSVVPKKPETKRSHLLAEIGAGTHLQAMLYALAFGDDAQGRYLFLHPELDLDSEQRAIAATLDPDLTERFERTVERTLDGLARGVHTARLSVRKNASFTANAACERCDVRAACSQGDSTASARFEALLSQPSASDWNRSLEPASDPEEQA